MTSQKLLAIALTTTSLLFVNFNQAEAQVTENCRGRAIFTTSNCVGDEIDSEEAKLYRLINQYRAQFGLPAIPLSPSLSLVANRHVRDLDSNLGYLTHGWSNCPYASNDFSSYSCMWEAPQRLGTPYPGKGYENAHGGSGGYTASAESALRSWQSSSGHNAVILNQGTWQDYPWNALGIGIYQGYAVLWFGEEPDPASDSSIQRRVPQQRIEQPSQNRPSSPPTTTAANNLCGSNFVSEPTIRTDSYDRSPYRVWFDFRRGQEEPNFSACGRQYWLKDDSSHYYYGIPFVYLVNGEGQCVVPFLYRETENGTLEVVRTAPECSTVYENPSDRQSDSNYTVPPNNSSPGSNSDYLW